MIRDIPSRGNEEIELYMRTYYSLLRSTSDIRITCIINESKVGDAVRALHSAFELDKAE